MRFLIVDDDLATRKLLMEYLRPYGCADFSDNGQFAIELFTADLEDDCPYDAVFLDIVMPGMDGCETQRAMRAIEKQHGKGETPIIIITSLDLPNTKDTCYLNGCSDYLIKPVTRTHIQESLEKAELALRVVAPCAT